MLRLYSKMLMSKIHTQPTLPMASNEQDSTKKENTLSFTALTQYEKCVEIESWRHLNICWKLPFWSLTESAVNNFFYVSRIRSIQSVLWVCAKTERTKQSTANHQHIGIAFTVMCEDANFDVSLGGRLFWLAHNSVHMKTSVSQRQRRTRINNSDSSNSIPYLENLVQTDPIRLANVQNVRQW